MLLEHKLANMFKIVHNLIYFPSDTFVPRHSRTESSVFHQPFARTNTFLHSFVPSVVSSWNSLPCNVTNAPTLSIFKHRLAIYINFCHVLVSRLHVIISSCYYCILCCMHKLYKKIYKNKIKMLVWGAYNYSYHYLTSFPSYCIVCIYIYIIMML